MKKSNFVKFASVMIILCMIVTLVACGSPSGTADTGKSTVSTAPVEKSTSSGTSEAVKTDPLGKYEPGITVTTVKTGDTASKFPEGDSIENNVWTRAIEKDLGITVKCLWVADTAQDAYKNKLNVSIVSGEIPDIFSCDSVQLSQLVKAGLVQPLEDAYNTYASDELKDLMDAFKPALKSGYRDGKMMSLASQASNYGFGGSLLWIRDDWMKKFGFSAPKTIAELETIMDAFVNKDPDGNNKKDTYGLAVTKEIFGSIFSLDGIFSAYHASALGVWNRDAQGRIVYGAIQPEAKNALATLQNWYKKGYIKKEFGVSDSNKIIEDINSNKVGIEFGFGWNCYWPLNDTCKKDINATWTAYDLPSSDDKPAKMSVTFPVDTYYVVNKNFKNPEAIIKLANHYLSLIGDKSCTTENYYKYCVDEKGNELYKWGVFYCTYADRDIRDFEHTNEALKTKDASKLAVWEKAHYDGIVNLLDKGDPSGYPYLGMYGPNGSAGILKTLIDQDRIILDELRGPQTPTGVQKKSTLDGMEKETFTRIIMGKPLDEFDKFVSNWKAAGGEVITKEMNDTYGKQ